MKFIRVIRHHSVGIEIYFFNCEEFKYFMYDSEPQTKEIILKIENKKFKGIGRNFSAHDFSCFLTDENPEFFTITIYDHHELLPEYEHEDDE